jgi:hypothetical protein
MARLGRRRRTAILVAVGGALVAAGVLVWFQPQKLVIDERVDEAPPAATATTAGAPAPASLGAGTFRSLGHETSGRAAVLDLGAGRRLLRLEQLSTSNGPDLYVYLSTTPAGGSRDAFDDDFASLGRLKANQGNQNYDIPGSVDLDRYRTVVIWCRRFTYAFGAAELR